MKRLYFKKWVNNTLLIYEFLLVIVMGGLIDNIETPTSEIIPWFVVFIINTLLLIKYGRFEDEEAED